MKKPAVILATLVLAVTGLVAVGAASPASAKDITWGKVKQNRDITWGKKNQRDITWGRAVINKRDITWG